MLNIKDIAWVAGLLEGEGCFTLAGDPKGPIVKLAMTDKDIIVRFAKLFNSTVCEAISSTKNKNVYITTLYGRNAVGVMMTIYSLMGERRKGRIREVLNIWKNRKVNKQLILGDTCNQGHLITKNNLIYKSNLTLSCRICRNKSALKHYHKTA